jgi:predicted metallo-beta-lactamase superfamily hydrolase
VLELHHIFISGLFQYIMATQYTPEMFEQTIKGIKELDDFLHEVIAVTSRMDKNDWESYLNDDLLERLGKEAKETKQTIADVVRQKMKDSDELKGLRKELVELKKLMDSFENRKN